MTGFVDPYTKAPLREDQEGNLFSEESGKRAVYENHGGVYDFVHPETRVGEEKHFYDGQYLGAVEERVTLEELREHWTDTLRPENYTLLESMGDISGKRILLLGNGISRKELYFMHLGAEIVFTDLSVEAAVHMQQLHARSELRELGYDAVEFHAVDALHLPFPDKSFDIIYGSAFVHHLEDLDSLFSEVSRCLRDGGICRFLDGAYSQVWQTAKHTILKPVRMHVYSRRPASPEDMRATTRGGYRKEELERIMTKFGFKRMVFIRFSFFLFISKRAVGKLIGWQKSVFRVFRPFLLLAKWSDDFLQKTGLLADNLVSLVWGFDK
jgi:ubiquinone/menaquinone biosynthesis C-methylase UbiE